ncbi:CHAP domain-containing protein [Candidatus Parcubacteria bacterium]|nr:MAG: CHAP domain-containing protein [Candidatus Parcubacteria bacterium]
MKKSDFVFGIGLLCLAMPVFARDNYERVVDKNYYVDQYFEKDSQGQEKIHIFLGGERIVTFDEEEEYFPLSDHLGSPTIVTDKNGEIVEINDYEDYGDVVQSSGGVSDYKFIGKEWDSETDLQYFGARYYNADIGRFMSIDPLLLQNPGRFLSDPQQLNSYSYARNNPIAWIDFWGLSSATTNSMPEDGWQLDQVMGQFNGVEAKYNGMGSDRIESSCVEYAKRYMSQVYGINNIGSVGNPRNMWNNIDAINKKLSDAGSDYQFVKYNNGQGLNLPQEGDLLIWTQGTHGHVMVVTESVFDNASGTGHVEIIDQNVGTEAVRKYDIVKNDGGYSIMKNKTTAMAGWLSPVNKNAKANSTVTSGYSSPSSGVSTQKSSFFQRAWNSTKSFFKGLFK